MLPGIHGILDLLAASGALALTVIVYRWRLGQMTEGIMQRAGGGYAVALIAGAVIGGYGLGTLNLALMGVEGIGRSILGALAGAVLGVEIFKSARGIRGSTGLIFVAGFCASVVVGRIGCVLSGLEDYTFGTPTSLPWGVDFGDGIARHPVALYESLAMLAFLAWFLAALGRRAPLVMRNGFHLMVAAYAGQRFLWEFLKPYPTVAGPLNLFHLTCLALLAYAGLMIARRQNVPA